MLKRKFFYWLTISNFLYIIILLILAGVTIAALSGDNGILTNATKAREKTNEANAREQVEIAVTGSIGTDGQIDNESLETNLNKIENISGVPEGITDADYPFTVTVDGKYDYVIRKDTILNDVVDREGIEVGDYVNYTYDLVEEGISLTREETGRNQTIHQPSSIKWVVCNIEEDGTN